VQNQADIVEVDDAPKSVGHTREQAFQVRASG